MTLKKFKKLPSNYNMSKIQEVINNQPVLFDVENLGLNNDEDSDYLEAGELLGYQTTTTDIPFIGGNAGGDWEHPVYFILYLSKENKLKAYVPRKGNTFNSKTMSAYGSEEDSEIFDTLSEEEQEAIIEYADEHEGNYDFAIDAQLLKEDIEEFLSNKFKG